jgi:hypothetical protein
MTIKDPSFLTNVPGEMVLVKPNGSMQFWNGTKQTQAPIKFESEATAIAFAREKGWREVPLAV